MFIEDLWEKNPELVIKAVKKIFYVREEKGDTLRLDKFENGVLSFTKYGHVGQCIQLSDFCVGEAITSPYPPTTGYALQWVKFMHNIYGKKYALQYISFRNKQLDKFMHEYENDYNNQTNQVLEEMGVKKHQGMQNQTK